MKVNGTYKRYDHQDEILERDEFLDTLNTIFKKSRWFGVAPRRRSLLFIWAIINAVLMMAVEAGAIWKLIRAITGTVFNTAGGHSLVARLSGSIFYANGLLSLALSWRLITSWSSVHSYWIKTELNRSLFLPPDVHIKKRVIFITSLVVTCALGEHILSMISAIGFRCPPSEYMEKYILVSHGFLIHKNEYHIWLAIPIFIVSKTATVLWNFQDLIIILLSTGLTSRYKRLNSYVKNLVEIEQSQEMKKHANEIYIEVQTWRRVREAYIHQANLVRRVSNKLGALILLSSLNNFYFICLQLFLGINKDKGEMINRLYHFLSLSWLMLRASGVALVGADVDEHSRKALKYMKMCSNHNVEIERLKNQMKNDRVVLRGLGFFALDRNMFLKVAAAIMKYELVLVQYDK
uniref:Gustatory receptor n=1 Tax=Histia rhodope TaxID=1453155 RepID=A0A7G4KBY8_9NEOP|nr:gustatory receptor [Histia rhodope]